MSVLSVHTVTSIVFLRGGPSVETSAEVKFDQVLCTQSSLLPILAYTSEERMLQTRDNTLCHLRVA